MTRLALIGLQPLAKLSDLDIQLLCGHCSFLFVANVSDHAAAAHDDALAKLAIRRSRPSVRRF